MNQIERFLIPCFLLILIPGSLSSYPLPCLSGDLTCTGTGSLMSGPVCCQTSLNETCYNNPQGSICCAAPLKGCLAFAAVGGVPAQYKCVTSSSTCCGDVANTVCASGQTCCGSTCCSSGSTCSNGVCSSSTPAPATASSYTIGLKVALLTATGDASNEATLGPMIDILQGYGALYDKIVVTPSTVLNFFDASGNPKYYAIAVTNQHLYSSITGGSMTQVQSDYISNYKKTYNVRFFSAFSYPNAAVYNVTLPTEGTASNVYLQFDTEGKSLANGVNPNAVFTLSNIFHYPASIPAGVTNIKPLFRFTSTTAAATSSNPLAAAIWKMPDNTEEMHFLFDSASWTQYGVVVASVWLNWLTKGVIVGHRRVYLSTQVDDVFLSTEVWNGSPNTPGAAWRMQGPEFPWLTTYMNTLNSQKLPSGSNYKIELAFNGEGKENDAMWINALANRDDFFWCSHTWSHFDLTCPDDNCTINPPTTYQQAFTEFSNNINFVNTALFADKNFASYSPNAMVTPRISGLFNPNSLQAMRDNGIYCAVGDNTRTDLQASNWYQGFYTQYSNIFIIPRFATRIGYDNALPEHTISQQMYLYGPNGVVIPFFNHNVTLDELLILERERVLPYLAAFRHDPYMFHQANLRLFTYNGKTTSLLAQWVDYVTEYYTRFFSLPVKTLKENDLWQSYLKRRDRDNCGLSAYMTITGCQATQITMTSTGTCEAVITGIQSTGLTYEKYGPDDTVFVPMTAASRVIPFSSPKGMC